MTEAVPVTRDQPAVVVSAFQQWKQRLDRQTARLSALLSHAVMAGLLALGLVVQQGPAGQLGFAQAQVSPTSMPDIRARTVTTVRISAPRRIENEPDAQTSTVPAASQPETSAEPTVTASWPEAEIAAAVRQCAAVLADRNVQYEHAPPIRQGICGTPAPVNLKAIGRPEVSLQPPATMNCAVAAAVGTWVDRVLQPAASEIFSSPVVRLVGTGSYTCRNRNGAADGPISEHAFANAFDVSGFVLADGRTVNVLGGWGRVARDAGAAKPVQVAAATPGKPPLAPDSRSALKGPPVVVAAAPAAEPKADVTSEAKFLRRIHGEACRIFGTVLGPEANDAHRNHLHFDLKDRKGKAYCQ
jgi:hypothetical protein